MSIVKTTKFLKFEENEVHTGIAALSPRNYRVWNKKGVALGWINYYEDWKKYVFTPTSNAIIFDAICLREIASFLKELDS